MVTHFESCGVSRPRHVSTERARRRSVLELLAVNQVYLRAGDFPRSPLPRKHHGGREACVWTPTGADIRAISSMQPQKRYNTMNR